MIITLLGVERNLGIITLTDHLLINLSKANTAVLGWNFLVQDYKPILDKMTAFKQEGKNVILKYVLPKIKFNNQGISYPKEIDEISDVVFLVPTYREEIAPQVPLKFYKGEDNPIFEVIKKYYT